MGLLRRLLLEKPYGHRSTLSKFFTSPPAVRYLFVCHSRTSKHESRALVRDSARFQGLSLRAKPYANANAVKTGGNFFTSTYEYNTEC